MTSQDDVIQRRFVSILRDFKTIISTDASNSDFQSRWSELHSDFFDLRDKGVLAQETENIAADVANAIECLCLSLGDLDIVEESLEDTSLSNVSIPMENSPSDSLVIPKVEDKPALMVEWNERPIASEALKLSGASHLAPRSRAPYPTPSPTSSPESTRMNLPAQASLVVKPGQSRPELSIPSPATSNGLLSPQSSVQPESLPPSPVSQWTRSVSPESAAAATLATSRRKRNPKRQQQFPTPSPSSSERSLSSSRSPSPSRTSIPTTAFHPLQSSLNSKPFACSAALWLLDNLHRPYPSDRTRQSILIFCGSADPSPELAASSELCVPTPLATHRRDLDAWFTYARKRIGWSRNLNRKHLTQFFARHDSNGLEEEDREKLIEMRRRAEDLVRETGGPEVAIPIWTPPASVKSRNESVVPAQTSATSKRTRSDDEDDNEMEEATNKRTRYVAYEKSTDEPEWLAPSTPTQAKEEDQIVVLTFNNDSSRSDIPAGKDEPATNGLGLTMESSSLSVHKRRRSTDEPIDERTSPMDRSKRRRVVSDSDTSFGTPSSLPRSQQMLRSVSAPAPPPPPGPSSSSASCNRKQEIRTISLSGDPNIWAHFDLNEKPERPEQGVNKMGSFSRVQSRQAMRRRAVPRFGETTGPGLRKHCEHAPGRMFPPPAPAAFFSQSSSLQMFPPPQPQAIALSLPGDFEVVEKAYGEEGSLDYIPSLDGFGTELCFR